jgi:lactoylglutathione lyase
VRDVERSANFYEKGFGFERLYRFPREGEPEYVYLERQKSGLGLARSDDERRGGLEICIYVDDVDAAADQLRALAAAEIEPPTDRPWGERMAYFDDPDGHRLHVTTKA